jgi:hypothetical protein
MTRRRRIVVTVFVFALVLGTGWWVMADGLSSDELELVGAWTVTDVEGDFIWDRWVLKADRVAVGTGSSAVITGTFTTTCPWHYRAGRLVFDGEPNKLRRAFRPLLQMIGVPVGETRDYVVESRGADTMHVIAPNELRQTWTRDRSE